MNKQLVDLIEKMSLSEPGVDSDNSISWQAHRDAEKLDDPLLIPEILEYLNQNPRRWQKAAAYFIIGKIGKNTQNPECAGAILSRLNIETDKYVLSSMLDRLADLPKPSNMDLSLIFTFLYDKRWLVRHSAIRSLINTNSLQVEVELLRLLGTSSDPYDIIYCHAVLNKIGTLKSLPALHEGLKSSKRDVKSSAHAAIAAITARNPIQ